MRFLDVFERGALFRLTRLLTLLIILVLTIGLLVGAILFASEFESTHNPPIRYDTIARELSPAPQQNQSAPTPDAAEIPTYSRNIPDTLKPYFSSVEAQNTLENHLRPLDPDEQQEYLKNLSDIVFEAKAYRGNIPETIERYFEDKDQRLASLKSESSARLERQLIIAGSFMGTLILIALASLILVLLAIERNTRLASGTLRPTSV